MGPVDFFLFVVMVKEGATNYSLLAEANMEIWWGEITHHICPRLGQNVPKTVIVQLNGHPKKSWISAFVKKLAYILYGLQLAVLRPSLISPTGLWEEGKHSSRALG